MAKKKAKKASSSKGKTKAKPKLRPKLKPKPKSAPSLRKLRAAAAADSDKVEVVVQMSNDGPYLVSQITVNDLDMLDKAIQTAEPQCRIDITEVFSPGARIAWRLVGAIQFPKAGVFLHCPDVREDQLLGSKAPLRKGVAWVDEKASKPC